MVEIQGFSTKPKSTAKLFAGRSTATKLCGVLFARVLSVKLQLNILCHRRQVSLVSSMLAKGHHLRSRGMIRFPCNYQQTMVSHGFKVVQDFVIPQYLLSREPQRKEYKGILWNSLDLPDLWSIDVCSSVATAANRPNRNDPFLVSPFGIPSLVAPNGCGSKLNRGLCRFWSMFPLIYQNYILVPVF